MRMSRALWVMLLVWLAVYGWSVWIALTTEPTGDGFTRGLNRIVGFMIWQMAAAGFAVAIWVMGRNLPLRTTARWISRIPGLIALLPILVVAVLAAYFQIAQPTEAVTPAPTNQKPVTAPVD